MCIRDSVYTEGLKKTAEYEWQVNGQWCKLSAQALGVPAHPQEGSLEQFITEHYWGYSNQRNGGCLEYHVSHEPWRVWACTAAAVEGDASALYGSKLGSVLGRPPDSAFLADGSPVIVFTGNRIS